jgi:hypothetical protein
MNDRWEEYGRALIDSTLETFASAYDARRRCKASLEGLMIELDIKAAYEGTKPPVRKAFAHAIQSAVNAADAGVPLHVALVILRTETEARMGTLIREMKPKARKKGR